MSSPARERWTIRIEPLASTVPAINRVRSALKVLLRAFRLKCTAVLVAPADGQTAEIPQFDKTDGAPAIIRGTDTTEQHR